MQIIAYIFLALIIAGFLFQLISSYIDEIKYKPPGRIINSDGVKFHILEKGKPVKGRPNVILDMGLGGNLLYWHEVQEDIAKFAKVISFDRAGIGWSLRSSKPRTSTNIIEETRNMLVKAGIKPPYILVGHSFAGLNARLYAKKYPDEVVGIVLVDSSHEMQNLSLPKAKSLMNQVLDRPYLHLPLRFLSRIGVIRLYRKFSSDSGTFKNKEIGHLARIKESSNKFIDTIIDEWRVFDANLESARNLDKSLGNLPLTVITAAMGISPETCALHGHFSMDRCKKAHKVWHECQKDLLTRSSNSRQILAKNSTHIIQQCEPKLIVSAVKDMLDSL